MAHGALLPPGCRESDQGPQQPHERLGMTNVQHQQQGQGKRHRTQPPLPQGWKLGSGGECCGDQSPVRADQAGLHHAGNPAVLRILGNLGHQEESRDTGELASKEDTCRLREAKVPFGQAEEEEDHQGNQDKGQDVRSEEQRRPYGPPLTGLQTSKCHTGYRKPLFRRSGKEAPRNDGNHNEKAEHRRSEGGSTQMPRSLP